MSPAAASCPACGGEVSFRTGDAAVVRCRYCGSAVARTDRGLEDLGKFAAVVETDSPLALGVKGAWDGVPFELVGRAQLAHPSGAAWEEWYARLSDGRWGWLAEAQGKFYWTFRREAGADARLPSFDDLQAGQAVALPGAAASERWVVAETSVARLTAADGEIPYRAEPNAEYDFADLSGPAGACATIDYSEEAPLLFVGREVKLAALGFPPAVLARGRAARPVAVRAVGCPRCGGALELHAPDETERVACPSCGALLDATQGQLRFLKQLTLPKEKPFVPLGARGRLDGTTWTVIGYAIRSVRIDGTKYFWQEYLLYERTTGFRWLVRSDDHWSFVETIPAGDVLETGRGARCRGRDFKPFQDATARVVAVAGEFPWKVAAGERVRALDLVAPPYSLSREATLADGGSGPEDGAERDAGTATSDEEAAPEAPAASEVTWSLGRFLSVGEVEEAFGVEGLPRPAGIAPNQPYPYGRVYPLWIAASLAWLAVLAFLFVTIRPVKVLDETIDLSPTPPGESTVWFSPPVALAAWRNVMVEVAADVDNSWEWVEGDFYEKESGTVLPFAMSVEYWHGVAGGERWNEGAQRGRAFLSSPAAGEYTLRLEIERGGERPPKLARVRVEQGRPRPSHAFWALGLLCAIPLAVAIHHGIFEQRRWAESHLASGGDA